MTVKITELFENGQPTGKFTPVLELKHKGNLVQFRVCQCDHDTIESASQCEVADANLKMANVAGEPPEVVLVRTGIRSWQKEYDRVRGLRRFAQTPDTLLERQAAELFGSVVSLMGGGPSAAN